jgi:cytochrome d ubiquinol oxidase subunit I
MDVVLLSRIQFALTIGFHFLFPPTTLGLSFIILIFETLYIRSKEEIYKKISSFLVRILGLVFVIGTATGIVMEFSFGNNWAEYSKMVGDIFGAPLAAEGVFAFFLESVFLGVLVFARNRVSKKAYWWSAFFVFFGSHLSGLWIIIANSWMQTPAGFKIENGKAVLTNFFQAAVNHSTFNRYTHVILSAWITGGAFVAAIGAYYLLKKRFIPEAKKIFTVGAIVFIIFSMLQLVSGHAGAVKVAETQPAKLAAFEGIWKTTTHAQLDIFGIPDEKNKITHLEIGIPGMLSYLVYWDTNGKIQGLNEFGEDIPPVFLTYTVYHIMTGLGFFFIFVSLLGIYLFWRKKIWDSKWFLRLMILSTPLVYVAVQTGWMAAEIGRQPWIVYGIMKTNDAVSKVVPAGQILFSLIMFTLIYILLFIIFMKILFKFIKKGPEDKIIQGY